MSVSPEFAKQPITWYGHGIIAAAVPPIGSYFVADGDLYVTLIISLAILVAYMIREARDQARKIGEGSWSVEWKLDRAGDLIGPWAVTVKCLMDYVMEVVG